MASSNTLTDDMVPPRRPGIDDLGGGAKINGTDPPNASTGVVAEDFNQLSKQIAALRKVLPVAIFTVRFTAGVPSVNQSALVTGNAVVVTVTDNGVGDTSLTWPANSFPGAAVDPFACVTELVSAPTVSCVAIANGVQVKTWDNANAAADYRFTVTLY